MRFSFQPQQAYIITTDLTIPQVHALLEQKFNAETATKKWWSYRYNSSYYMGVGDTFRIEKEVKEGRAEIEMVAIAHLATDKDKTIISIQYDGYNFLLNIIMWLFTIVTTLTALIFLSLLITAKVNSSSLLGVLISFIVCLAPQIIRIYYDGFVSAFHSQVLHTLKRAQKVADF